MENFKTIAETSTGDASRKLCMEVIEGHWTQQTGGTAAEFEGALREQLNAPNASREELNKLYVDAIRAREIKNHGPFGEKIFNTSMEIWHCK